MDFLWHPMAVHFPVALWLASFLFDLEHAWRRDAFSALAAMRLIALGLAGAGVSIVLGFVDYLAQVRAGVGAAFAALHLIHSALAYAATAVYLLSFALRRLRPALAPGWRVGLGAAGAVLVALAGWYGGEMRAVM